MEEGVLEMIHIPPTSPLATHDSEQRKLGWLCTAPKFPSDFTIEIFLLFGVLSP